VLFYNQALVLDNKNIDALNDRGIVYYNQGKYEAAITDYSNALQLEPDNSRIIINLILVYIASDDFDKAAVQFNQYRQKNLSGYMEQNKAFAFLKKYITACTDFLTKKDYKEALPLLQASLEEYKQSSEDQNTNKLLANEYSNIVYRTGWVLQNLNENDKALEYYKKAKVLNPSFTNISSVIENLEQKINNDAAVNNTPPSVRLLTPAIERNNIIQGNSNDLFVSGVVKDATTIDWIKVNGENVSLQAGGYFSLNVKNASSGLVIQASSKKGLISSETYQLQAQTNSKGDEMDIQPIPPDQKPVFHAVLIACSNYTGQWNKLPSTVEEAKRYKELLVSKYGFKNENIVELYDKTYSEILSKLFSKVQSLTDNDNLVILYAGHGTYRKAGTEIIGYWVPINATSPETDYISNNKLDEILSGCQARHILMLSDACYSAAMRGNGDDDIHAVQQKYEYKFKSRQMLTSGGLEKVPGESVFINMVMKVLEQNEDKYLSAKVLYNLIFNSVRNQTNKEPELNIFGKDGNEGGQFYFIMNK
jgi:tetratricopeptide (TPR) repeat protein